MSLFDNHQTVSSSHVKSIGHQGDTLEVAFKRRDGSTSGVYRYYGVPSSIIAHLLESDSKGAYLKSTIQGFYRTERVS